MKKHALLVISGVILLASVSLFIYSRAGDGVSELNKKIDKREEVVMNKYDVYIQAENDRKEANVKLDGLYQEKREMLGLAKGDFKSERNTLKTNDIQGQEIIEFPNFIYEWKVNKDGQSKRRRETAGDTVEEKVQSLLEVYNLGETHEQRKRLGDKYNIKYPVGICIAWADSGLGESLLTKNNIGNVGNNDRGNKVSYKTLGDGIEAIYMTLNNEYLSKHDTIGELSQGGRTELGIKGCGEKGEHCYATSPENWNNNVVNCMNMLYNERKDESFNFRTK